MGVSMATGSSPLLNTHRHQRCSTNCQNQASNSPDRDGNLVSKASAQNQTQQPLINSSLESPCITGVQTLVIHQGERVCGTQASFRPSDQQKFA
jgi:hypothetical protein